MKRRHRRTRSSRGRTRAAAMRSGWETGRHAIWVEPPQHALSRRCCGTAPAVAERGCRMQGMRCSSNRDRASAAIRDDGSDCAGRRSAASRVGGAADLANNSGGWRSGPARSVALALDEGGRALHGRASQEERSPRGTVVLRESGAAGTLNRIQFAQRARAVDSATAISAATRRRRWAAWRAPRRTRPQRLLASATRPAAPHCSRSEVVVVALGRSRREAARRARRIGVIAASTRLLALVQVHRRLGGFTGCRRTP